MNESAVERLAQRMRRLVRKEADTRDDVGISDHLLRWFAREAISYLGEHPEDLSMMPSWIQYPESKRHTPP